MNNESWLDFFWKLLCAAKEYVPLAYWFTAISLIIGYVAFAVLYAFFLKKIRIARKWFFAITLICAIMLPVILMLGYHLNNYKLSINIECIDCKLGDGWISVLGDKKHIASKVEYNVNKSSITDTGLDINVDSRFYDFYKPIEEISKKQLKIVLKSAFKYADIVEPKWKTMLTNDGIDIEVKFYNVNNRVYCIDKDSIEFYIDGERTVIPYDKEKCVARGTVSMDIMKNPIALHRLSLFYNSREFGRNVLFYKLVPFVDFDSLNGWVRREDSKVSLYCDNNSCEEYIFCDDLKVDLKHGTSLKFSFLFLDSDAALKVKIGKTGGDILYFLLNESSLSRMRLMKYDMITERDEELSRIYLQRNVNNKQPLTLEIHIIPLEKSESPNSYIFSAMLTYTPLHYGIKLQDTLIKKIDNIRLKDGSIYVGSILYKKNGGDSIKFLDSSQISNCDRI